MAILKVCRQPAAISGAGGQTPGGRPGRREWSWSKAEVEAFDPPAQSLTGRGAGAALGPVLGPLRPSPRAPALGLDPQRGSLVFPPRSPAALQRLPGGGAPREAQAPGGGGGGAEREASGIGDPVGRSPPLFPSWELCRGRGLEGTRWGTQAALDLGAAAVIGARCGGRPEEGRRC